MQQRPESASRVLLHRRQRVRVDVECRGDLLVAEPLLHDVRGDARLEQQRGGGMPEPVDRDGAKRASTYERTTPGRPPPGPAGARVSDFPRLTVRLPGATRDLLEQLSVWRRVPVWKLVDQAVLALIAQLPEDERRDLTRARKRMTERAD